MVVCGLVALSDFYRKHVSSNNLAGGIDWCYQLTEQPFPET